MSEDSSVERLRKKLYSRDKVPESRPRRELHDEAHDVSEGWTNQEDIRAAQDLEEDPEQMLEALREGRAPGSPGTQEPSIFRDERVSSDAIKKKTKQRMMSRVIRMVFIASLLFFILSAGIAAYFLVKGKNQVSCDNLDIDIGGPISVPSGKELVLNIGITNHNPVAMRQTDLVIDYPIGTRSPQNTSIGLTTTRELIDDIELGEAVRTTARSMLFGREQEEQEIQVTVEYRIDDSNAIFYCEVPYRILIATAPVSLTVEGLEEISSGQELELEVAITSNSSETVPDLRLVADYPFGFEFVSADPEPMSDNNVWELGDVGAGTTRTLKIRGIVYGQGTEARAVNFSVGEKDRAASGKLSTILQMIEHPLLITRPFLMLDLLLNKSDSPELAVLFGDTVTGKLTWKNTLPYALHDVEIEATLPSLMVDPSSVEASTGFFRSVDRTLLWTPQTYPTFRTLEPSAEGTITFSFKTRPLLDSTSVTNPAMNIEFMVRARRISDDVPVHETLTGQAKRTIKFVSDVQFTPRSVYGVGPFTNTGPHPPRVDQETTYTILWNVKNTTNDVEQVHVRGELPIYVTWLDNMAPANETVSYNPVTREVMWSLGDVPAGTGFQSAEREVAFQVALMPSISQFGGTPALIINPTLRGVDRFTGSVIERSIQSLSTRLTDDPFFPKTSGSVTE